MLVALIVPDLSSLVDAADNKGNLTWLPHHNRHIYFIQERLRKILSFDVLLSGHTVDLQLVRDSVSNHEENLSSIALSIAASFNLQLPT